MTLKLKMIGALLATGLLGAAGQAKADVFRGNVGPDHGRYVQTAPRPAHPDRWQRRRHDRPVAVAPVPGYGHRILVARAQDPSVVAAEVRAEMDQAAQDLRFDVRQGVVERRALASLDADRQEIERDLAAASVKGYITSGDRTHLEQHVQELRDLRNQFRCAPVGQVTNWR